MMKSHPQSGERRRYRAVIYSFRRPLIIVAVVLFLLGALLLALEVIHRGEAHGAEPAAKAPAADRYAWRSLFDGKTLQGWKSTPFGGEGKVEVRDGAIVMPAGNDMTGVTFTGKPPRRNYELSFEGKRLSGSDFFCTATFPVEGSYCSLVMGGWGGTVVGISCVDSEDASENITSKFMSFDNGRWYQVRIRVAEGKIESWIDREQVVDLETEDHRFSTRMECDDCQPLGFATWCTAGAVRNIRIRELRPDSAEESKGESAKPGAKPPSKK